MSLIGQLVKKSSKMMNDNVRGTSPFLLCKAILTPTSSPSTKKDTGLLTRTQANHNPPVVLEEAQRPPVQVQLHAHYVPRPERLRVPLPLRLPLVAAWLIRTVHGKVRCGR